jgi:hypothetical protein
MNWVLRRIFGPNREEVTGDWSHMDNEKFHNLYCSPDIMIMKPRISWACKMHEIKMHTKL